MEKNRAQELKEKMALIATLIERGNEKELNVEEVNYYHDFQFKGTGLAQEDVFIAKVVNKTDNNITYEIYSETTNSLIATVTPDGKIHFMPEYLEMLRDINEEYFETLRLEDSEFELPELEKEDISLPQEDLKEEKDKVKIKDVEELMEDEEVKSYSEADVNQKVFDKVTNKQEIDADVRVTETETIADMIPSIKEKGFVKIGVVYSEKVEGGSGMFSFVGITQDGNIELVDGLENIEGTTTGQKVTSINNIDGSKIEQEQVAGMVRINGRNSFNGEEEYLSVKVGQYGILEVDYVRENLGADEENRYFSAPIETNSIQPTTREVRSIMDKTRNTSLEDEQKKASPEINRDDETMVENIDDTASNDFLSIDDIIVLENGEETTIRKESKKAKVSPEEFLEKYETYGGKTPDEIIDKVHEEIEEEYIGNNTRSR